MSDADNWPNPASLDEFLESFRLALVDQAKLEPEAKRQDDQRKIILAEIINHTEGPIASRPNIALATDRYREACDSLKEARTKANLADAKVKWMETRFEAWRSRNATKRAEMQLK